MAGKTKKGGEGKRRRWKPIRANPPPEWIFPPYMRSALGGPIDPNWFKVIDRELVRCHERFDRGDKTAVLDALLVIAATFPAWLREATSSALLAYLHYTVKTLDEAFEVERPKGQHFKDARKREVLRPQIILNVYCRYAKGEPLDQGMFDRVGDDLNISGSEAAKIFSEPASDELRELARNLRISD